jgi:ribonuclease P protein component
MEEKHLGVTVSRRVGNAVVRNQVKRGIREWFRRNRGHLSSVVDVVVIARREAAELSGREIESVLNRMVLPMEGSRT